MGDAPIPDRPEAISASWMSDALAASFPGIELSSIEVIDQHSGTTGRLRFGLHHAPGSVGPETVFVKLPPFDESQRKLVAATDMGRREARFYEGPASETPLRVPRPLYAAHGDERTEYIMVLEDLQATGCRFASRLDPFTEDQSHQLVEGLARHHARFWNDPRFEDELAWVQPAMRGPFGARLIERAREQFAGELPSVFGELCSLYIEHHEQICVLWDEGEQTLIHGDTHAGNQFYDGRAVGLYDWAVTSRSPGIRDVAIYLGNSCPTEVRRTSERGWLRAYGQTLLDAGIDAPPFEVLWERYRRAVLYAWVAATTTAAVGSRWQPIEVGRTGMARATTTCADLQTVDTIRAAL